MTDTTPSLLRLLLWPTVLTLLVNVARLVVQLQGWTTTQSGGGGAWLGITWLGILCGAWFGWRLARAGSTARLQPAWPWPLLSFLAIVGAVLWGFSGIDRGDSSEAAFPALRSAVLTGVAVAVAGALVQFFVWSRLALVLLLYALFARFTVVFLTWLAKDRGWDTHYTKFGPGGIQRDMAGTIESAVTAQIGFWVPFTIVSGMFAGCIVAGRQRGAQ
jgi:hypothetical protein